MVREVDPVAALEQCPAVLVPDALRAAIARPDDDGARRDLARALRAANHDDWAALIELQLRADRLSAIERDRQRELVWQQAPIIARYPLLHRAVAGKTGARGILDLRRGLVERARISAQTLIDHHQRIFALAPLCDLSLFPADVAQAGDLARIEQLSYLRHLRLASPELGDDGLATLLDSPHLRRLKTLDLYDVRISDRTLARLAGGALPALRSLSIGNSRHSPEATAALVHSPSVAGLRELALEGTWVDDAVLDELARSAATRLETLKVIHGRLGPALRTFAASPVAAGLRLVALTRCVRAPEAVVSLLEALGRLEALYLDGCGSGNELVRAIDRAGHRQTLTQLALCHAGLDARGAGRLAGTALPALGWLDLSRNAIGDEGAAALGNAAFAPALTRLTLDDNGIGPAGLAALLPPLRSLVTLDLSGNPLGDQGARILAATPALSRLEHLRLSACDIGPAGARAILDSPHLARAAWIALGSDAGREIQHRLELRRSRQDPFLFVTPARWG